VPATKRIIKLYKNLLNSKPSISVERARIYTEAMQEAGGMSTIMQRAIGLSRVLEKKEIRINDHELIVGNLTEKGRGAIVTPEFGWRWMLKELDLFSTRNADRLQISEKEKAELREIFQFWQGKSVEEVVDSNLNVAMKKAMVAGLTTLGGHATSIGNITPDYATLLKEGMTGVRNRVLTEMRQIGFDYIEDVEKMEFYQAALITIDAAVKFAGRFSDLALKLAHNGASPQGKQELKKIAAICHNVPCYPAQTFHEALQSLWFTHLIINIESSPHGLLLGRIDQYLFPFYQKDLETGRMTRTQARELLACFWIKVTELIKIRDQFYSESFSGFPLFQVAMIGGVDENGNDATNDLSYLILEVIEEVRTTQPSISLRYHSKTPDRFLKEACRVVKAGLGIPAFVNDNIIIPKMLIRGASIKEARNYVTNCIEPEIPGMTDSRAHSGYVNFGKCIELALNNGVDPVSGEKIGLETGELKSFKVFNDFYRAVLKQIKLAIELIEKAYNMCESIHAQIVPEVFLSIFVSDCIARGKTRQSGGARYNHSTIFGTGPGTLVDSLAAVKKLVYDDKSIDLETFKAIIDKNFKGEARFRQMLLNKCPKFGNDVEEVDGLARKLVSYFCEEVQSRKSLRNGTYLAELHSVAMHVIFGKMCGATPDGRKKGKVLSDGISPVQGADRLGPTATIKSVAKIDHLNVLNGTLFNQKLNPQCLKTQADLEKFASLIKTYFTLGGHHIQFNVVDAETLKKAQQDPENFKSLIVRVAGYSAFFNELTRDVQDEIIQRTEQYLA